MSGTYKLLGVSLLFFILVVHAKDQAGFISIDCGRLNSSSYSEGTTGIIYVSDTSFIDSGESKFISSEYKEDYQQQLWSLRSFPQGTRNCYKINNIKNGTKYLIRTSFLYGNYDGQGTLPEFELYLGANMWDSIKLETVGSYSLVKEIIHIPLQNYIDVCLVNIGLGTPFISSIELRPLSLSYYKTQTGSLALLYRWDTGPKGNRGYRYPRDVNDRFWYPYHREDWTNISTSLTIEPDDDIYQLPSVVMSTAATPKSENGSLEYWLPKDNNSARYYVYLHIAEVENLQPNQSRRFTVSYGGEVFEPKSLVFKQSTTLFSRSGHVGGQPFIISRTPNSTLPPIINAIEVYVVKQFLQSDTLQTDADAMTKLKSTYGVKKNWQGDPCVPELYSWEGLNCSKDGYDPPRITSLNLSSSGLTGEIPFAISNLTMLEVLDLSYNNFTGSVPEFLSKLTNLRIVNLEKNNLNGSVPVQLIEKSNNGTLELSVGQNPNLCVSVSCGKKKKKNAVVPVVASVSGTFALLVMVAAIYFGVKHKRKLKHAERSTTPYSSLESKKRQFTWSEILRITNNFERVLGQGGFGTVFYGLTDGTEVAVKVLSASSVQRYQQFHAEVNLLMRVHHRNLTSLIGYCNDGTNAALLYEYMANGNLKTHISGSAANKISIILKWEDRLRIALEAAQGLEYMHAGCKPPIVHRDVKSTNILLNENFQAKLSDLGLSKLFPADNQTHVSTVVAGTLGYLDPEYYMSNWLNEKSDVYSYRVVLLEIISGRPAVAKTHEKTHISTWVSSMLAKGDIKSIVDRRLQGNFDTNSVWKAVELAMACVSPASTKRPMMSQVVAELRDCLAAERARGWKSHEISDSIELSSLNMTTELRPVAR
ncbi:probable LRR receptor-like serine/threonine-protein kinase At1g05700 [Ziziphus jujuba]|uniref:non-specific serine/threonine protein kinase n=1 Tax=Ziziphus jujuba TaxID=326968 RepID=A0ABM4A124_ZIZJJ|nr:probable LRR receptor-like serine/threonine-protein kinase At1g05700 [Ziziphus jujuba]